jgi:hypothetical protein
MRQRFPCLCLMLCILFISPFAQSQLQKIYLSPKAAGSDKQSNFVDSLRFIPLEIKTGIELKQYNYVEVTTNYLLIRDFVDKAILLYTRDGRFVKKISYKRLGQMFYPAYDERTNQIIFFGNNSNYALTSRDRIKIKLDWNNPHNKKYYKKYVINLNDSSYTIKKATPLQNDILRARHFYDDIYGITEITTSELYKDSLDYEFKIYKENQLVKSFFPYNRINEPKFLYADESIGYTETDTSYIYYITRPFCDTIYKMVKDTLTPAYQLVLPLENSLPASFFTKPFKNKTERDNYRRNNGWLLHQVYGFYETPRFIYFFVSFFSNYEIYIYQKQNKITYNLKKIKTDSTQYNLQLLGDYGVSRDHDKFYKTVKAGEVVSFFEKHKDVAVPKELESFIKKNPPAASPVIVEFKLKN